MTDKWMTRIQGATEGTLHESEIDARLTAQRIVRETGKLVVLYECAMVTLFSKSGQRNVTP